MSAPSKKLTANQWVRKKDILLANFIGGLAWGLGSVIGATIFVAILVWVSSMLGLFDFLKDYFPQSRFGDIQLYKSN